MKKKIICLLLVLITICLLAACSSSPKEARAQISDPITITNVKKNNGNPATPSEKGYYTDSDTFYGSITLTLPEGLNFAVSFNKGDVLDTSWYEYSTLGNPSVDSSLKVKNDVSVGGTEIELEIHIECSDPHEDTYTFTFPNSIFNADYVGENPVFEFCIPRMS